MRAEQGDQLSEPGTRSRFPMVNFVVAALLIVAVALVLWLSGEDEAVAPPPEAITASPVVVPEQPRPAPDIPRAPPSPPPEPVAAADTVAPSPPPEPELPPAEESDAWLMTQLTDLGIRKSLLNLFDPAQPLSVSAKVLDGLSQGNLVRKMIPGWSPAGAFPAEQVGDSTYLDPAGFARYDTLVSTLVELEPGTIEQGFHLLRPLYERTYGELGLDPDDLDNALIRVLDQVIAAPVIEEPPQLKRESVMYTYSDPNLEALSPLHKQLLRMGPENTRRLQRHAGLVRAQLLREE
ncbi:MAG: DUF3014 domain-containing protein [Halioglobus sp.]|nr:DUF3014 domain-containing protein [Halioglobus sp.]